MPGFLCTGPGALKDQALADLFYRSGWTQEQLAKAEGVNRRYIGYRLTFGRFIAFGTSGSNFKLPVNLTERKFRGYWSQTKEEGSEARRFRKVAHMIEDVTNAPYLQDSGVLIDGVRFYGSPWQPEFLSWAFNLPRGSALAEKWAGIPGDTDVLITHGPPAGVLDRTAAGISAGCRDLAEAVSQRIKPKLHIFGHIHEGYGLVDKQGTTYVNACCCDERYQIGSRNAVVLELSSVNRSFFQIPIKKPATRRVLVNTIIKRATYAASAKSIST